MACGWCRLDLGLIGRSHQSQIEGLDCEPIQNMVID
jgi:hypothetical protein